MAISHYITKVVMNNGNEYIFGMHPDRFLERICDDNGKPLTGLVHFTNISINVSCISAIEHFGVQSNLDPSVLYKIWK